MTHHDSAPGMEVSCSKRIFGRSIEKYNLRYVDFYGDGDSKRFPAVKNIYPNTVVRKLECVGHVKNESVPDFEIKKKM